MRKCWWQSLGVCLMLVACGSSSKKKVTCREADVCVPGSEAGAPDAGPDVTESEGGADASAEAGPTDEGGVDAGGAAGAPADGGTPDASVATLEIVIVGNGSVAVGGEAACLTSSCQYSSNAGGVFALAANPAAGSRFAGWSGDCSGSAVTTSLAVAGAEQCTATFVAERAVSVTVDATGGGTVTTTPDLGCGVSGCAGQVDDQSQVTLNASALAGFRFVGWSGGPDCDGATQASLTIGVTRDLSCTAKFSHVYTVSVSAAGASGAVSVTNGTCTGLTCTADSGSSASFSAAPVAGFRFSGWSGSSGCTGAASPLQISQISSNIACVANYVVRRKVTGLVAGGLTGSVVATSPDVNATCSGNACSVDTGTSAKLVAPTVAGYRLTAWTGTGCNASAQSGNGITVTPTTADVTCTASYAAGVSVTGTVVGATGTVTATSTSPGASCTTGSCTIDAGGTVALTAPNLLPGFRFKGWSGDAGCAGTNLSLSLAAVSSSKACTASYVQEFVIASQAGAGGSATATTGGVACTGNSCTVDAGTSVVLTATADAANGYHFTSWSGAGCPTTTNPLTLSNVNATCKANFALNTFTIADTAGANGSVTATRTDTAALCAGNSCTVNFGTAVSLVATPALHFHFTGWTGAGCTPTTSSTLSLKNLNATCNAAFATDTFTASVTAAPVAGGTVGISCPAGNCSAVPYGQLVNVTATANPGWSFASWSANCNGGTASPNAVTITANTACVATFRPSVTATVTPAGAGTITASGTPNATCTSGSAASCTVDSGGSVSFVAVPATDAVFTGWSGDCTGTAVTAQLTGITAPKACTASFYRLWAQATGSVNADGMANVTALADGTVVGFGLSTATDPATGAQTSHMALVNLNANTGKLGQSTLFSDTAGGGGFAVLGLATTPNQKNVIALGVHAFVNSQLPWLHNEQAPAWEFEYGYSDDGLATGAGGEVIATTDGGFAFTVGVTDPKLGTMAHLTKVDASGKPVFDTQFCAPGPVGTAGTCSPTQPVDLLQDPSAKYFAVLSQVASGNTELMLTFLDETGKITGSALYADQGFNLHGVQFVPGSAADTFLVVGFVNDPKSNDDNAFYAQLNKAGTAPTFAVSLGAANVNEALTSVARTPTGYGFSGLFADPKLQNEAWLVLSDQTGKLSSQIAYGGAGGDRANAIAALPAGGFALGGGTNSFGAGGNDMWTLRVAGDGGLTFNSTSNATRYTTAFPTTAVSLIVTPVTPLTQGSAATASKPAVSSAVTGFTQMAQAP